MTTAWYDKGLEHFAGTGNWSTEAFRTTLVDLADYQVGSGITDATNATPIVITIASHGLSNGDHIVITGVGGNLAANGSFIIAAVATNTFELVGSVGTAAYTSGGHAVLLNGDFNYDDVPAGARVAEMTVDHQLKTITDGYLDAADVTYLAVTGDVSEGLVTFLNSGVESTSRLLFIHTVGTNLPVTPIGDDIVIQWQNSPIANLARL